MSRLFLALFLVSFVASPTRSTLADGNLDVVSGFKSKNVFQFDATAPFELQVGALAYTPGGEPIVYEDGAIRIHGASSTRVLATFSPAPFGSFLTLGPDGRSVYFGENTSGNIYRVPLDSDGDDEVLVDNLTFNFELAFAPEAAGPEIAGLGFLSGLGNGPAFNTIWLLDDDPETDDDVIVGSVPRFSGPLTFDPDGNLYYVTASAETIDVSVPQQLVRFTPTQLASAIGGTSLSLEDGEVLRTGLDGYFNLKWLGGMLHGTNLGFNLGFGTVESLDPLDNFSTIGLAAVNTGDAFGSPSVLAVHPGSSTFEPGSGPNGGRLLVAFSDFFNVSNVAEITAQLRFVRGEANGDERLNIADAVYIVNFLFLDGRPPVTGDAADANDDNRFNLADPQYVVNFIFLGGPPPPAPFPEPGFDDSP